MWTFFTISSKSSGGFHWNELSVSVFTNIMNNSVELRDRELQLFVLFFVNYIKMRSSVALECAVCVFFFFLENHEFGKKIRSKFGKPWEMKNLRRDCEKVSETVWYTVKPWELRGLKRSNSLEVFKASFNNGFNSLILRAS